jgi:hypothetical protein
MGEDDKCRRDKDGRPKRVLSLYLYSTLVILFLFAGV